MKNWFFTLFILGCFAFSAKAQDRAIFNHYMLNPVLINPAAAGFSESHTLLMNVRGQWSNFNGAPQTYALGYNGPIGRTLGLGAQILSENIASQSRLRFQMDYAFRYQVKSVKFAAGFSTDIARNSLSNSVYDNPLVDPNDEKLDDAINGETIFDVALGFYSEINEDTYVGISFPNMVAATVNDVAGSEPQGAPFKHVIFNVGHRFRLAEHNVVLEPSLMMRSMLNVPFSADFNFMSRFLNERLIAGLSYRLGTGGQTGLMVGGRFSDLTVLYGYELSFQRFQEYNSGSHEITVSFAFNKQKPKYDKAKHFR